MLPQYERGVATCDFDGGFFSQDVNKQNSLGDTFLT